MPAIYVREPGKEVISEQRSHSLHWRSRCAGDAATTQTNVSVRRIPDITPPHNYCNEQHVLFTHTPDIDALPIAPTGSLHVTLLQIADKSDIEARLRLPDAAQLQLSHATLTPVPTAPALHQPTLPAGSLQPLTARSPAHNPRKTHDRMTS